MHSDSDRRPSIVVSHDSEAFGQALRRLPADVQEKKGMRILLAGASEEQQEQVLLELLRTSDLATHQIDLSTLVSETREGTQGNLREMFDNAQMESSLLFFREADAFFEAVDRHEAGSGEDTLTAIDYLFQRMDAYEGAVVLCLAHPAYLARAREHAPLDLVVEYQ